jgi:hypothetical protein
MPIEEVDVELGWDPAKLSGSWAPDTAERDAAGECAQNLREELQRLRQLLLQRVEILRAFAL